MLLRPPKLELWYFGIPLLSGLICLNFRLKQGAWCPNSPWLLVGDFNSILSLEDKHDGAAVSTCETTDFRSCCSDHGLANLNYTGYQFTWSNGSVWSKLDRVLANSSWSSSHSQVHVHFGNPGAFSDHSPAIIRLESHHAKVTRIIFSIKLWMLSCIRNCSLSNHWWSWGCFR